MAAEEIVTLKVTTEGDQAALQSLTKIYQLIAKINGEKVNINSSQALLAFRRQIRSQPLYIDTINRLNKNLKIVGIPS